LVATAIAVAVAKNIAGAVARKTMEQGGPRAMQDRFMRMWDEMPDEAPPKRFLAAIEGTRADIARIRELLDAKNDADAASDS
jgi:hypothetical protein